VSSIAGILGLGLLLEVLIKSAAVLALGLALAGLLRRRSAALRHFVLSVFIIGLLLLPALSTFPAGWETRLLPAWLAADGRGVAAAPIDEGGMAASRASGRMSSFESIKDARSPGLAGAALSNPARDAESGPTARGRRSSVLAAAARAAAFGLVGLWLAGLAVLTARLGLGLAGASRLSRQAAPLDGPGWRDILRRFLSVVSVRRRVRLKSHGGVAIPMTWGLVRPVILMPRESEGWSEDERSSALFHEMAHVKRLDFLVTVLVRLSLAVYWLNPLARLAFRRLKSEQEKACDELVLRAGVRPSTYAANLLSLNRSAALRWSPPVALLGMIGLAGGSPLGERLTTILKTNMTLKEVHMKTKLALSALVICAVAVIGMARPTAVPAGPESLTNGSAVVAAASGDHQAQQVEKAKREEKARPAEQAKPATPPPAPAPTPKPEALSAATAPAAPDAAPAVPAVASAPHLAPPATRPAAGPAPQPARAAEQPAAPPATPTPPQQKAAVSKEQKNREAQPESEGQKKDQDKERKVRTIVIRPSNARKGPVEILVSEDGKSWTYRAGHAITLEVDESGQVFTIVPGGETIDLGKNGKAEIVVNGGTLSLVEKGNAVKIKEGSRLVLRTDKSGQEAVVVCEAPGLVIKEEGAPDVRLQVKKIDPEALAKLNALLEPHADLALRTEELSDQQLEKKLREIRERIERITEQRTESEKTLREVEESVKKVQDDALRARIEELSARLAKQIEANVADQEETLRRTEKQIEELTKRLQGDIESDTLKRIREKRSVREEKRLQLKKESLRRTLEQTEKALADMEGKIDIIVEKDGKPAKIVVGEEPHRFTIVRGGKEGDKETEVVVHPDRKGRAIGITKSDGNFEILFTGFAGDETQRERAVAEMKKALPEGYAISSTFDEKEQTFKVAVKGPKGGMDTLGLMKKLVQVGEAALK